mmetsp:Transcript_14895/g.42759  ORF Transcript_14895/g.42759 Transcript_14895/m.42759 type:complete len:272 (+) Transcript_14895:251-1066(+)
MDEGVVKNDHLPFLPSNRLVSNVHTYLTVRHDQTQVHAEPRSVAKVRLQSPAWSHAQEPRARAAHAAPGNLWARAQQVTRPRCMLAHKVYSLSLSEHVCREPVVSARPKLCLRIPGLLVQRTEGVPSCQDGINFTPDGCKICLEERSYGEVLQWIPPDGPLPQNRGGIVVHVEVDLVRIHPVQQPGVGQPLELPEERAQESQHPGARHHVPLLQHEVPPDLPCQHHGIAPAQVALPDEVVHARQRRVVAAGVHNGPVHELGRTVARVRVGL